MSKRTWKKDKRLHVSKDVGGKKTAHVAKSPITGRWFYLIEEDEETGVVSSNSSNSGVYFASPEEAKSAADDAYEDAKAEAEASPQAGIDDQE